MSSSTILRLPALSALPFLNAAFVGRVEGIDVDTDRETALARLASQHEAIRRGLDFGGGMATAAQVHGCGVACVEPGTIFPVPDSDALVTSTRGLCLGIYVADCAAIFLADRFGRAIGLAHSGKKGTELGIASRVVESVCTLAGGHPRDLVAVISPCIRPPHYEVDFAVEIHRQLVSSGVENVFDDGLCTASDPERFYSYRREKGKTGRMLALLELK
ncbi:MAG: polyphenol oxidase family protein [Terrimicrobiaceae bacterium]